MFLNSKYKVYLTLFLLFSVASSKGIIIYNEETLVALSFITFVIFCFHYSGNTVKDALDERSSTIQFELENFHRLKEASLQELLSEHKRMQELKKIFPSIGRFTQDQLSSLSSSACQSILLHNRFCEQVQQKLIQLQSSKTLLQQRLQSSIALTIRPLVLAKKNAMKPLKKSIKSSRKSGKSIKSGKSTKLVKPIRKVASLSSQVKRSLTTLKR